MSQKCRPLLRLEAELERHAAEDQAEQHDDQRQVGAGQDHRVGEREGREQPGAAEHQPGLVAVPDGRDRVHGEIAVLVGGQEREQDADPEIEAVEQHVHHDPDHDDRGPQQRQVDPEFRHGAYSAGSEIGPPADSGRRAVCSSGRSGGAPSIGSGPRWTRRIM